MLLITLLIFPFISSMRTKFKSQNKLKLKTESSIKIEDNS